MDNNSEYTTTLASSDLRILGVEVEEDSWKLAGVVESTGEEFQAEIVACELPPPRDRVAVWSGAELFTVVVVVRTHLVDRSTIELDNGSEYCDEDDDFDYSAAGMPVSVWRYVFGRIMAPVHLRDDVEG